jgi:hypothetical protein
LKGNGLQREKTRKNVKTRKKVQNIFRGTPDFLRNGPDFPAKTGPFQSASLQVAAVMMVMPSVISAFGAHGVRALPVLRQGGQSPVRHHPQ